MSGEREQVPELRTLCFDDIKAIRHHDAPTAAVVSSQLKGVPR